MKGSFASLVIFLMLEKGSFDAVEVTLAVLNQIEFLSRFHHAILVLNHLDVLLDAQPFPDVDTLSILAHVQFGKLQSLKIVPAIIAISAALRGRLKSKLLVLALHEVFEVIVLDRHGQAVKLVISTEVVAQVVFVIIRVLIRLFLHHIIEELLFCCIPLLVIAPVLPI